MEGKKNTSACTFACVAGVCACDVMVVCSCVCARVCVSTYVCVMVLVVVGWRWRTRSRGGRDISRSSEKAGLKYAVCIAIT